MINIEAKQKEILATEFDDALIYDIEVFYLGDELQICYEDEEDKYWRLTFLTCGKVEYHNDALWENWRGDRAFRDRTILEFGYRFTNFYMEVYKENQNFIKCSIELASLMQLTVICRDIKIEHLNLSEAHFFWQDNEKKRRLEHDKH